MSFREKSIQQFVIGTGFLSGIWFRIGMNPNYEMFKASLEAISKMLPNQDVGFLFWLVPIIAISFSLIGTYRNGGGMGLITVGIAFLAGILIDTQPIGGILLVLAVILGQIAPKTKF